MFQISFYISKDKDINIEMLINNREVIQCIKCCLKDLSLKKRGISFFPEEEDTWEYSLKTLYKFMLFYIKYGGSNKTIKYYLDEVILRDIGNICNYFARKYKISEILSVCEDYFYILNKNYSIIEVINTVSKYLLEKLNNEGIEVLIHKSQSSNSIYMNLGSVLKSIRISDHISKDHTRCFNIICCNVLPEKPIKESNFIYTTKDCFKFSINKLVDILKKEKEDFINGR